MKDTALRTITCPLCGAAYVPNDSGCSSCPLGKNCKNLVCCPECGYKTVDINNITFGRKKEKRNKKHKGRDNA